MPSVVGMGRIRAASVAALAAAAMVVSAGTAAAAVDAGQPSAAAGHLRVATMDAHLTRDAEGGLAVDLASGNDAEALRLAAVVQRERPDVLVLTGLDVDPDGVVVSTLRDSYFGAGRDGLRGMDYGYSFSAPTNAGVQSGTDLDGDGQIGGPGDAFGYGEFEGASSLAVFSTQPIDMANVRTFNDLLWSQVPGNHLRRSGLGSVARSSIPLQGTSLWDVPIGQGEDALHVLATAVTADPEEGEAQEVRRADQLSFLKRFAAGDPRLRTVADDKGREGALPRHARAVVVGDLGGEAEAVHDAPLRDLLDGTAVVDPEQGALDVSVPASWWGDSLGRVLRASASATRLGDEFGRRDIAAPTLSTALLGSGLSSVPASSDGDERRMVWVDVAR